MPKDKETQDLIKEGQMIDDFVNSDGWKFARNLLEDKIIDIQSVRNIDAENPEQAVIDIKSRRAAVEIMLEWVKDVEGRAEQFRANQTDAVLPDHIIRT